MLELLVHPDHRSCGQGTLEREPAVHDAPRSLDERHMWDAAFATAPT